jgi:hypothetical protein
MLTSVRGALVKDILHSVYFSNIDCTNFDEILLFLVSLTMSRVLVSTFQKKILAYNKLAKFSIATKTEFIYIYRNR